MNGYKYITLNRPQVHNAFNRETIAEVTEAFREKCNDRAIIFGGEGKTFSAGADLNYMREMANFTADENFTDAEALFDMFYAVYNSPVPTVARVHGTAMGGALGLISCCDMAVGVKSATFSFSEVKIGILPAVISPFLYAKLPYSALSHLFLSGARFQGEHAHRINLLTHLAEDAADLDAIIDSIKRDLGSNAKNAVRETKRLLRKLNEHQDPLSVKSDVCERIARLRGLEEGKEGLTAFLEKRKPSWAQ